MSFHSSVYAAAATTATAGGERRAFTIARPLRMQGFAPPVSSPGRRVFKGFSAVFPSLSGSIFAG
ncbi:hypothetical protein MUA04_03150 [Enterobacteriaceae bacterium H11S18]|uniref:hypothetical protein n=1 Tax=Dryocola clanedunensis TaxID=2925396 RepID=UPI0022F0B369|nr:hypothetical protein [Dryocola clanedunensis]MCT4709193.1 hypothetical protein [Dryocola clanedunensis]